jgi:hypothetical protein
MINHARTLLLNRPGNTRPLPTFFGEELVPAEFRPVDLTGSLASLHQALFGTNPDDAGMNYRLWEYMRLLHSTDFVAYVTDLDSRFTYMHERPIDLNAFGTIVTPNNDIAEAATTSVVGAPNLGARDNQLREHWEVEALTNNFVRSTRRSTQQTEDTELLFTDGLSNQAFMAGETEFSLRFQASLVGGERWDVVSLLEPQLDFAAVLADVVAIKGATLREVFQGGEPFHTFKRLFEQHNLLPYQLSGLLLALIYRTEEIRTSG